MFGKEKKAEDKKKETALKREENRKKSGVKHKKPKQKQAGNGNLSCLFGLGSAAVLAGCIAYALYESLLYFSDTSCIFLSLPLICLLFFIIYLFSLLFIFCLLIQTSDKYRKK